MAGRGRKRPATAIEYGIALVAARSRTEKGLRERLEARYPAAEVEGAMERLRELRLVDDAAYAERFAQDRSGRVGHGRHRIARDLQKRGIDGRVAEAALAVVLQEDTERVRAQAVLNTLRARLARSEGDADEAAQGVGGDRLAQRQEADRRRNRLFRRMLARGYSASLVRDLMSVS